MCRRAEPRRSIPWRRSGTNNLFLASVDPRFADTIHSGRGSTDNEIHPHDEWPEIGLGRVHEMAPGSAGTAHRVHEVVLEEAQGPGRVDFGRWADCPERCETGAG